MKSNYFYILFLFYFNTPVFSQTLQEYLLEAEKNNFELQSQLNTYQSALEKINEEGSLPNITIAAGYFVQEAETRVGAQKAKLSISQNLPWFGTLNAKKKSAMYKANAAQNTVDISKRKLFLNIKQTYFELYELNAKEAILTENLSLLNTIESWALNQLENNKSSMVDVLKIKIQKNEITEKIQLNAEKLNALKISFNLLLNKNLYSEIKILDTIVLDENTELFNKNLINNNPKLIQLENLKDALNKSELVAKKESYPNIGLGIDYILVENRPNLTMVDNGKDIIMPMLMVSIPLFSKKYSSKQKQLQLEQKSVEATKQDTYNQLLSVFEQALANLKNAKTTISTQTENIFQANEAEKILLTAYETNKIDFKQLLEIQQLKLSFQLKKISSEKEYANQKAILEFLTLNN